MVCTTVSIYTIEVQKFEPIWGRSTLPFSTGQNNSEEGRIPLGHVVSLIIKSCGMNGQKFGCVRDDQQNQNMVLFFPLNAKHIGTNCFWFCPLISGWLFSHTVLLATENRSSHLVLFLYLLKSIPPHMGSIMMYKRI